MSSYGGCRRLSKLAQKANVAVAELTWLVHRMGVWFHAASTIAAIESDAGDAF